MAKLSPQAVQAYLAKPEHERPGVGYDPQLLDHAKLLSSDQVGRMEKIACLQSPLDPRQIQKLLIDLSWASSHLEGNTYTHLDTKTLIEWGEKNPSRGEDEAAMILNHKEAITRLLQQPILSIDTITKLHRDLSNNRGIVGSRHLLEPDKQGTLRESGDIVISGSSYFPPTALGPGMQQELERIVETASKADPINASLYLLTRLPYLQPFLDVNKRTSRIAANLPLLAGGMAPLSFVGVEKAAYTKGIVAFYELGHEELLTRTIVEHYGLAALGLRAKGADERMLVTNESNKIRSQILSYVLEGIHPLHPVLARVTDEGCKARPSTPGMRI